MFWSQKQLKIKTMFMYFWLNHCGENLIKKTPIAVENIDHLFRLASAIIEADRLHLFLLSYGTRIDEDEYLSSLERRYSINSLHGGTNPKIYFELKRYLSLKNISYPLNIDYFLWRLTTFRLAAFSKITLMLLKRYKPCSKCFLMAFAYDFEQAKRVQNE